MLSPMFEANANYAGMRVPDVLTYTFVAYEDGLWRVYSRMYGGTGFVPWASDPNYEIARRKAQKQHNRLARLNGMNLQMRHKYASRLIDEAEKKTQREIAALPIHGQPI